MELGLDMWPGPILSTTRTSLTQTGSSSCLRFKRVDLPDLCAEGPRLKPGGPAGLGPIRPTGPRQKPGGPAGLTPVRPTGPSTTFAHKITKRAVSNSNRSIKIL